MSRSISQTGSFGVGKILRGIGCLLILLAGAYPAFAKCKGNANVLGVSRVAVIDTTGGPRFGGVQYRGADFLRPKEVVLTFDDGPSRRYTSRVLDALGEQCTKATFFLVGRMAVSDPKMVREIDARGHTIATHTWSHQNLRHQSPQRAESEIELGISAIQKALGRPISPFFRFPYLADSKSALAKFQKRNIAIFSIDVDSRDFRTSSGRQVRNNIMGQLRARGKGILLFHDIQVSTARGIRSVLASLQKGGYKVVHIVPKTATTTLERYDTAALKVLAGKRSGLKIGNRRRRSGVVAPVMGTGIIGLRLRRQIAPDSIGRPGSRRRPNDEPDWKRAIFSND